MLYYVWVCSRFPGGSQEKSGDSSIKIFRQNEQRNKKNKKKMLFCQWRWVKAVKVFWKKYSFGRVAEKRKIFFKKHVGLDLDGQAHRANFASFFWIFESPLIANWSKEMSYNSLTSWNVNKNQDDRWSNCSESIKTRISPEIGL